MRRTSLLIVTLLVAAACGGDDGSDTTTTLGSTTTSSTTTTMGTTTTVEATTTTQATTTTLRPGNWADVGLVVSPYGALGYWDGLAWVQITEFTPLPIDGGEDYQVVRLGVEAVVTGGPEERICEPLNNPGVELSDLAVLGGPFPDPVGLAISAPWDLTPHFVQDETDDGAYSDFARPLLAALGLAVPNPVIKQVVRFDMDGDGSNEVIAVAEEITGDAGIYGEEGNYSVVFMRTVVDGEVQTAVLAESVVADLSEGEFPFILSYAVAAIADLSGDGKMEIVLNERYYEGAGWSVWEYVNDDLGAVMQIVSGCGV